MIEEMMRSVLEQDRSAVVLCDLEHTIVYMNPAAEKNYAKYGGGSLLGRSLLSCHNRVRRSVRWLRGLPRTGRTICCIREKMKSRTRISTWWPCGTETGR